MIFVQSVSVIFGKTKIFYFENTEFGELQIRCSNIHEIAQSNVLN